MHIFSASTPSFAAVERHRPRAKSWSLHLVHMQGLPKQTLPAHHCDAAAGEMARRQELVALVCWSISSPIPSLQTLQPWQYLCDKVQSTQVRATREVSSRMFCYSQRVGLVLPTALPSTEPVGGFG